MKKIITIVLAFCLLINSSIIAFASDSDSITMWTTANLRARTGPSLDADIYDVLPKGSAIECINEGDEWNTVLIDSKEYYMYNDYLSYEEQEKTTVTTDISNAIYSPKTFKRDGVIHWNGWTWTYYSQRVLPGGGLKIPGRHVGPGGYIMDENGRICLASSTLSKGTIVDTPFGTQGCVYDSGCASNVLDVYTDF